MRCFAGRDRTMAPDLTANPHNHIKLPAPTLLAAPSDRPNGRRVVRFVHFPPQELPQSPYPRS